MEETEKKTSDQEADDLKGTGREGIQLAKELGQVIKKSAGNNAGSLFESEKGEGIPAPLQGGQNPLDLSHTKDASSITGDSATTERGRKTVGQGMLPDRNSSPQNGRAPQKRGEIPKPQRGTSLQGAKKTANASGAALVELFFGNVSSGQGSVLLDADENGIPQVPYIHQGFGVYDFTSNSYTHTEILSHSFPDGTIAVNDSASTQRTYWTNGKKGWTKAQIDACESGYPTYTILVCPDAMKKRENRNAKAEAIVQACHAVPSPGMGLCAAWVTNVYRTAGAGNPVGGRKGYVCGTPGAIRKRSKGTKRTIARHDRCLKALQRRERRADV
ncbi:MAG: hypothetical protein K5744_08905 [Eubacterium sp.]|nr:hypothetical protein [Eubacterium sp.]